MIVKSLCDVCKNAVWLLSNHEFLGCAKDDEQVEKIEGDECNDFVFELLE